MGSIVLVGVGVGVGVVVVGVGVGVEPIAPIGSPIAVGVGVTDGFGVGTTTPLFHTSFLPLLIQVYFLPR